VFAAAPEVLIKRRGDGTIDSGPPSLPPDLVAATLEKLPVLRTGYDNYALESYTAFTEKKADGHISKHTRFQVSLPGLVSAMAMVTTAFQSVLEPRYEAALVQSLQSIQETIPHSELAVQIDAAIEIAFIEGAGPWPPYFEPIFDGIIERLSRIANKVAEDVEIGFHLCYGDVGHRHFVEPKDLGLLVRVANALHKKIQRPIQWIHVPVPKGRKDLEYFSPLKELDWKVPEIYLGLVHPNDLEGTKERIAMAQKVVTEFGVATECGMGRTPPEDFDTIMDILNAVSTPISTFSE
jgi:methionine synthase II (cobalamin-independent)